MDWIKRGWRGEERLWVIFWGYGVFVGIIMAIVFPLAKNAFANSVWVYIGIKIIYSIWLLVAEWRCAFNVNWRFWGYLIRFFVTLTPVALVLGIGIGMGMVGQDLIKAAECRKEMKEYVAHGGTDVEKFKKQCIARQMNKAGITIAPPVQAPINPMGYEEACRSTMTEYAKNHSIDPQQYITQNQAYLQECVQYYNKNAANRKSQ